MVDFEVAGSPVNNKGLSLWNIFPIQSSWFLLNDDTYSDIKIQTDSSIFINQVVLIVSIVGTWM